MALILNNLVLARINRMECLNENTDIFLRSHNHYCFLRLFQNVTEKEAMLTTAYSLTSLNLLLLLMCLCILVCINTPLTILFFAPLDVFVLFSSLPMRGANYLQKPANASFSSIALHIKNIVVMILLPDIFTLPNMYHFFKNVSLPGGGLNCIIVMSIAQVYRHTNSNITLKRTLIQYVYYSNYYS